MNMSIQFIFVGAISSKAFEGGWSSLDFRWLDVFQEPEVPVAVIEEVGDGGKEKVV